MNRRCSLRGLKLGMALCFAVTLATAAIAEDAKPAPLVSADDLKKSLGMSIYLQGGYTYNGSASTGEINDLRIFDQKANSFLLDLAQIVFAKDAASGSIGYKVKISAGETAKYIHSAGLTSSAGNDPFDLTEAYISYTAPQGKGLRFDFGKFATFIGGEVIEAIDNPNYSRSFLFNYATPLTHTGLKVSYTFTDVWNANIHIVNGWDNSTDNNRAKSIGASVGYTPTGSFSLLVNGMTGPEQDEQGVHAPTVGSSSGNMRTLLDIVATIRPIKTLSIILNYDDGREENVPGTLLPSGISSDVKWNGLEGIVKYDFSDKYSLAVRAEYFDDKDGFRTGAVQKLKEVTVTSEIRMSGGLILRPEYRHDSSDKPSFDNKTKKDQDTLALGAMYRW